MIQNFVKIVVFGGLAMVVSACATTGTYQNASSGQIGCAPDDIKISDDSTSMSTASWKAECRNKVFYCSAVGKIVSCKEKLN